MSAPDNENNIKAGLEQVTQEEHDEATSLFEALADPELSADLTSTLASDAPADPNSIDNVFYVNFNPKTGDLPEAWRMKLDAVSKNVNLSHAFMNRKANLNVADAVKKGDISEKDPVKKANYLAKCLNVYTTNAPWIATTAVVTQEKKFTVEKEAFHKALITNFTTGLGLPPTILEKLENFLTNVQSTIKNSSSSSYSTTIYVLILLYAKDDVLQTWRPYIRTISFKPSQSLSEYARKKGDKSSGVTVDIDFTYVQFDGAFNVDLFERSAKPALSAGLDKDVTEFVNDKNFVQISVD